MKPSCYKRFLILSLALLINIAALAQDNTNTLRMDDVCLTPTEASLARQINKYRKEKRLPAVKLSKSLSYVAQTHVRDLVNNYRESQRCNLHSWSGKGRWTSCCYTSDQRKASCMWNKPRELTDYKGDGFEIAFYSTFTYATPDAFAADILKGWKGSKGHNQVIINGGMWKDVEWKAMGIGIYGEYAVVWFGRLDDDAGIPGVCTE